MWTYKDKCLRIAWSVLSVVLGGLCLLGLSLLLDQGTQAAAPVLGELASGETVLAAPRIQANGAYTQYMPLIARNYGALINGDFEQGLYGWKTVQGPLWLTETEVFVGSGLPVGTASLSSGNAALLGLTSAANNAIPVGYGTLYQSFIVRDRYLRFRYWVYSYDVAYSSDRYRDTFEVSINRPLAGVSDGERDARGCSGAALNPQGLLAVPGDGLVMCAGQPGETGGLLWDTGGWRTVTLDLDAYRGQWITLAVGVWSREYVSPFTSDQAWYNTWAYVDDVHFSSSASAATMAEAGADLPSPDVPAEARMARFSWNVEGLTPPR